MVHLQPIILALKSKAWVLARKSGDPSSWLAFWKLLNKFTPSVRKAKSDYYLNTISSCYTNPAKFWQVVNSTKSRNVISLPMYVNYDQFVISDQTEICTVFNNHFAAAGQLLKKETKASGKSMRNSEMDAAEYTKVIYKSYSPIYPPSSH